LQGECLVSRVIKGKGEMIIKNDMEINASRNDNIKTDYKNNLFKVKNDDIQSTGSKQLLTKKDENIRLKETD
jgi:exosome complex RNA-binding protein Csl4